MIKSKHSIVFLTSVYFIFWVVRSFYELSQYQVHIDDTIVSLSHLENIASQRFSECQSVLQRWLRTPPSWFCEIIVSKLSVPLSTTYAPMPFVFSSIWQIELPINLIPLAEIEARLVHSRLPMLVFFILGLISILFLFFRISGSLEKVTYVAIITIIIFSISLQFRFYTFQSSPYTTSLIGSVLLYFSLFKLVSATKLWEIILSAFAYSLAISLSYTHIYTSFTIMIILVAITIQKKISLLNFLIFISMCIPFAVLYLPFLFKVFLEFNSPSVNWNIGVDGQFLLISGGDNSLFQVIFTGVRAFFEMYGTLFSPFEMHTIYYQILGFLLTAGLFWILFKYKFLINKNDSKNELFYYSIYIIIIWTIVIIFGLNIFGFLPLSPTRHLMGFASFIFLGSMILLTRVVDTKFIKLLFMLILPVMIYHNFHFEHIIKDRRHQLSSIVKNINLNCIDCKSIVFERNSKELLLSNHLNKKYKLTELDDFCANEHLPSKFFFYSITLPFERKKTVCNFDEDFKIIQLYNFKKNKQIGLSQSVFNDGNNYYLEVIEVIGR